MFFGVVLYIIAAVFFIFTVLNLKQDNYIIAYITLIGNIFVMFIGTIIMFKY